MHTLEQLKACYARLCEQRAVLERKPAQQAKVAAWALSVLTQITMMENPKEKPTLYLRLFQKG